MDLGTALGGGTTSKLHPKKSTCHSINSLAYPTVSLFLLMRKNLTQIGLIGLRDREAEIVVDHNPLVEEDKKHVTEVRDTGKRFKVGWAEMIGQRPSMEDAMCIEGSLPIDGSSNVAELFALFDGHAGREAAHHSALHVKATVVKYLSELVKSNERTAQELFAKVRATSNETGVKDSQLISIRFSLN